MTRTSIHNVYAYAFLAMVLIAPLFLGANRPIIWSPLAALVGLLLIAGAMLWPQDQFKKALFSTSFWLIAGAFGITLLWALFQICPCVSQEMMHPIWLETASFLDEPPRNTISIQPSAAPVAIMRLLSYAGVFIISLVIFTDRRLARMALMAFMIVTALYAIYGLSVYFLDMRKVLWFERLHQETLLSSTFINKNHYATYAGLGGLVSLAILFHRLGSFLKTNASHGNLLKNFLETGIERAWNPLLAALLNITALMLTESRGALFAFIIATIALVGLFIAVRQISRGYIFPFLLVNFFALAYATLFSGERTLERVMALGATTIRRSDVYHQVIKAISDNPWLGSGLGTFENAFRPYRMSSFSSLHWLQAHNTPLELMMDLGLPIAILFLSIFLIILWDCLRGAFHRRRDQIYPIIGASVTILVGLHSLVDFSMQIPAIAFTFSMLAGLGIAQSPSSGPRTH